MLSLALMLAAGSPALDLVDDVEKGCAPRLLDDKRYPFWEAQTACDAYLTFALVDEILAGEERAPRVKAIDALVDDVVSARGRAVFRSTGVDVVDGVDVPRSVLYRGYLLVMLAGLSRVDALSPARARLFDDVAAGLVRDLDASQTGWLESFKGGIWPCDHALAAAGLVLHGELRASSPAAAASTRAGHELAARMDRLRETSAAGFPARVDKRGNAVDKEARGTVLAWTAGFLGIAGLDEAKAFAQTLVDDLCGEPLPGAAACREWPRGSKRGEDAVSGPIVMGWGTGASALAIAATRITGDTERADALQATSTTALDALHAKRGPLERAILTWGAGARAWRS